MDIISNLDFHQLIDAHQPDRLATLVVSQRDTQRYFLFDNDLRLCGWTNKATGEIRPKEIREFENLNIQQIQPQSSNLQIFKSSNVRQLTENELAFSGIQVVSQQIFNEMDGFGDKFSITELYIQKCGTNLIKGFVPQDYRMMDVGKINQLAEAELFASEI